MEADLSTVATDAGGGAVPQPPQPPQMSHPHSLFVDSLVGSEKDSDVFARTCESQDRILSLLRSTKECLTAFNASSATDLSDMQVSFKQNRELLKAMHADLDKLSTRSQALRQRIQDMKSNS